MKNLLLSLLSLPLLSLSGLIIWSFKDLDFQSTSEVKTALLVGFISGCLLFTLVSRFTRVYVFGHERADWIFAKIILRETRNFKACAKHGAVEIINPNIWITLAPYFYPTFTFFWIPTWFLFQHFQNRLTYGTQIYFFGLTLTWAYHFILTIYALSRKQSDIQRYGKAISFSLIIFVNLVSIYTFLSFFTFSFSQSFVNLANSSIDNIYDLYTFLRGFTKL
ncbi:MAG: hypothetical protein HRT88_03210 [Lentisphaeraceae bacterium]|nr:hypothetical protein [Lentisphaeraceae bacterium]